MSAALKILVISAFDRADANATRDFLFSFNAYSRHVYRYVFDPRVLDDQVDLAAFDVILMFWGLDLLGPDLSSATRRRIAAAEATKVLFLQDEYRDVRRVNEAMRELGVEMLFTCVSPADHDAFYPRELIPTLRLVSTVLPGYVPRYLAEMRVDRDAPRPLDIGYRSRAMPYYLGDLGQDKRIIAERFERLGPRHGLRGDISVREEDRLYGRRWVRFLRSTRCVLGSSSGASVIDFTGEIRRNCEAHLALNPAASYDDVKARFFADQDWKVVIDTVSPRVFEAAALRATMVHYEGHYGGILIPDRHYIALKRDYSNVADVLDRIRDIGFTRQVADNAHEDLIATGRYSYRRFVESVDGELERAARAPRRPSAIPTAIFYGAQYLHHRQRIVPYGQRFFVLPSVALGFDVLRRGLSLLPPARLGPVLSRVVRDPQNVVTKAVALMAVVLRSGPLRTLGRHGLRTGSARALFGVLDDLRKLHLVEQARAGRLRSRQPFRIAVRLDAGPGVLTFRSVPADDAGREGHAQDGVPSPLETALRGGQVRVVLWDHSALGHQVVYRTGRGAWLTAGVGAGGVHRFAAIERALGAAPQTAGPALLAVLAPERGSR